MSVLMCVIHYGLINYELWQLTLPSYKVSLDGRISAWAGKQQRVEM